MVNPEAETSYYHGIAAMRNDQPEEAFVLLGRAAAETVGHWKNDAVRQMVKYHMDRKQYQEAAEAAAEFFWADEDNADFFLFLTLFQHGGSGWEEPFERLFLKYPPSFRHIHALEILHESGKTPPDSLHPVLVEMKRLLAAGELRRAYDWGNEFLNENISDTPAVPEQFFGDYRLAAARSGRSSAGAERLQRFAESGSGMPDREGRYRLYEAIGMLLRTAGRHREAFGWFEKALAEAEGHERERMRWYLFDGAVKTSAVNAAGKFAGFASEWENPSFHSDTLFTLGTALVRAGRWNTIRDLVPLLKDYGPSSALSRFAYLAARAAREGLISADDELVARWFRTAFEHGTGVGSGLYYRIMAAFHSDEIDPEGVWMFPESAAGRPGTGNPKTENPDTENSAAGNPDEENPDPVDDRFFSGFAVHGVPERGYELYSANPGTGYRISPETARSIARALIERNNYLHALRFAARYFSRSGAGLGREDAELLYPRAFEDEIRQVSETEGVPGHVFIALVREESHFSPDIKSHAGAVGLSQLMPSTAADIARRIRMHDSDLTDPVTNLTMGAWYLSHLMGRTENLSLALYAYNGGLTRVRRWRSEFPALPDDLFLESIPFPETSDYGRKLLVSSVIYGDLYYEEHYHSVISQFFPRMKE